MWQDTSFLGNIPLHERNRVIETVVEQDKTHAESREFTPKPKNSKALELELELAFEDATVTRNLPVIRILWNVQQGNQERVASLSARLRLNDQRIRGVDRESAPVAYKFREETRTHAYWHHNVYFIDSDGVLKKDHNPLGDWDDNYTTDQFAQKTAELWNINTWREQEELPLWKHKTKS